MNDNCSWVPDYFYGGGYKQVQIFEALKAAGPHPPCNGDTHLSSYL